MTSGCLALCAGFWRNKGGGKVLLIGKTVESERLH